MTVQDTLLHTAAIMHRQTDQILQERLGIGISQYRIIALLMDRPDATQRQLADTLGQTEASISRQIKLLQSRGMAQVATSTHNKRENRVAITAKAAKLLQAAQAVVDEYFEPPMLALSSKQHEALTQALATLHAYSCQPGRARACDYVHHQS
jgi:DNA-binding MarR family transcriptional regulator